MKNMENYDIKNIANENNLICKIKNCENEDVTSKLYNCKNAVVENNKQVNQAYRSNRKSNNPFSVVWVLIATKNHNTICIQVGRNSTMETMLSHDINPNTNIIQKQPDKKTARVIRYVNLLNDYDELAFHEIDIDNYIENDTTIYNLLKKQTNLQNDFLKEAYYHILAAYVEGKLAFEYNAKLWNKSSDIDGSIYNYFSEK